MFNKRGQVGVQIVLVLILVVLLVILLILLLNPSILINGNVYGDKTSYSNGNYQNSQNTQYSQMGRTCETVRVPYYINEVYLGYEYNRYDYEDLRYSNNLYGVYVKNVDEESGDFKVRFYYRDDYYGDTKTRTITKEIDEREGAVFYLSGEDVKYVYSYRVSSEDDLDYISYPLDENRNHNRYNTRASPVERTRQVLKYRDEVRCY